MLTDPSPTPLCPRLADHRINPLSWQVEPREHAVDHLDRALDLFDDHVCGAEGVQLAPGCVVYSVGSDGGLIEAFPESESLKGCRNLS